MALMLWLNWQHDDDDDHCKHWMPTAGAGAASAGSWPKVSEFEQASLYKSPVRATHLPVKQNSVVLAHGKPCTTTTGSGGGLLFPKLVGL
jgi:hypothetical protein